MEDTTPPVDLTRRALILGVLAAPLVGTAAFADSLDTLEEGLKRILRSAKDSKKIIDSSPGGPLTDREKEQLDKALRQIERPLRLILHPSVAPSLNPADAGDILYAVRPLTLEEYADFILQYASEAYMEDRFGSGDAVYVGSRLRTIQFWVPKFRKLAEL